MEDTSGLTTGDIKMITILYLSNRKCNLALKLINTMMPNVESRMKDILVFPSESFHANEAIGRRTDASHSSDFRSRILDRPSHLYC